MTCEGVPLFVRLLLDSGISGISGIKLRTHEHERGRSACSPQVQLYKLYSKSPKELRVSEGWVHFPSV
jgi:hypothetical protein